MDRDIDALLGFAPEYDAPIPYMQRTREYYAAIGYIHAVSLGALSWRRRSRPLRKPLSRCAAGHRHHRGAVPARTRATRGRARRTTAAPSSIRSIRAIPRTTTTCASPISATIAPTPRRPTAARGFRCRRCAARWRPDASARWRRASMARRPIAAIASPWRPTRRRSCRRCRAGRRRCRDPGRPNCPVCHQTSTPGRAPSGGERHRHRGDGLRQGHRRARRRAAFPVQRFPARQQRRQAARRGVAGPDAGAGAAPARNGTGAAHDRCSRRCAGARTPTGSSTT